LKTNHVLAETNVAILVLAFVIVTERVASNTQRKKGQTFSISVPSAANGKPFTAGFVTEVD
jgi:hypothetical protein